MSGGVLQPPALGKGKAGCADSSGRPVIPSQDAGGDVVIPGVSFRASMIISAGARLQLSVTVQLPGLSGACRGFQSSLSFISYVGKKSVLPTGDLWISTAVAYKRFGRGVVFKVPFRKCHLSVEFPFCSCR